MKLLSILFLFTASLAAQSVSAPNVVLPGPSEFEAVITADVSNIAAYQFDIVYNPNVIALQYTDEAHNFGCSLDNTIDANMSVTCNGYQPGRLIVVVWGSVAFSGCGDLLRTHLVTVEGHYSPLNFDRVQFFHWKGQTPVDAYNGSVTIGSSGICTVLGC